MDLLPWGGCAPSCWFLPTQPSNQTDDEKLDCSFFPRTKGTKVARKVEPEAKTVERGMPTPARSVETFGL